MQKLKRRFIFAMLMLIILSACSGAPPPTADTQAETVESVPENEPDQASKTEIESEPEQSSGNTSGLFSFVTDTYMAIVTEGDFVRHTVFYPDDVVHAIVKFDKTPEDIVIKCAWFAVNVEGREPGFLVEKPIEVPGGKSGQIDFDLANQYGWPTGDYSVEIFVNEYRISTMAFSVISDPSVGETEE
jgi:hypothetical protein